MCVVFAWSSAVQLFIALVYLFEWERAAIGLVGKQADGRIPWPRFLAALPYIAPSRALWYARHSVSAEDGWNEVDGGLVVGRFPLGSPSREEHFPQTAVGVVDLTCEFQARRRLRESANYLCVPSLDNSLPSAAALADAARRVVAWGPTGPVYVHCANGHGRSASLAACVMLLRGRADSFEDAFRRMQRKRPRVHIHERQMRVLQATGLAGAVVEGAVRDGGAGGSG